MASLAQANGIKSSKLTSKFAHITSPVELNKMLDKTQHEPHQPTKLVSKHLQALPTTADFKAIIHASDCPLEHILVRTPNILKEELTKLILTLPPERQLGARTYMAMNTIIPSEYRRNICYGCSQKYSYVAEFENDNTTERDSNESIVQKQHSKLESNADDNLNLSKKWYSHNFYESDSDDEPLSLLHKIEKTNEDLTDESNSMNLWNSDTASGSVTPVSVSDEIDNTEDTYYFDNEIIVEKKKVKRLKPSWKFISMKSKHASAAALNQTNQNKVEGTSRSSNNKLPLTSKLAAAVTDKQKKNKIKHNMELVKTSKKISGAKKKQHANSLYIMIVNGSPTTFSKCDYHEFTHWFGTESKLTLDGKKATFNTRGFANNEILMKLRDGNKIDITAYRQAKNPESSPRKTFIGTFVIPKPDVLKQYQFCRTTDGYLVIQKIRGSFPLPIEPKPTQPLLELESSKIAPHPYFVNTNIIDTPQNRPPPDIFPLVKRMMGAFLATNSDTKSYINNNTFASDNDDDKASSSNNSSNTTDDNTIISDDDSDNNSDTTNCGGHGYCWD